MIDRIAKLTAARDNARGLAVISRDVANRYHAAGLLSLAKHHRIKARLWKEAADDLDKQLAYEKGDAKP